MDQSEENTEWRIAALCSFVPVLFCIPLYLILFDGLGSRGFLFLYAFTVLPLMLYGIQRYGGFFTKTGEITVSGWAALLFNGLFCSYLSCSLDIKHLSSGILYVMTAYLFLTLLRPVLFKNNAVGIAITPITGAVVSGLILGLVLLMFLNTFIAHMWFDPFNGIAVEIPQWGGWPAVMIGIFAVVSAYVLWRTQSNANNHRLRWMALVYLSPFLLFSIQSSFDLAHYGAYMGPAIAVLHGKIPLIDVFCQYGLGYLLFTLAFMVLPNTYAVAAAIVSLMNIGSFVVYLLILRIFIRNAYTFALIGTVSVFGIYFCNALSVNILPSALGLRYLPSMLFVYFLLRGQSFQENRLNSGPNIGFLLLNALWSAECLVFYFLIAGFYQWLMTHSPKAVCLSMGRLLCVLLLAAVVLCAVYGVFFGQFPSYLTYLRYPLSYLRHLKGLELFNQQINPLMGWHVFFLPMALVSLSFFYWSLFATKENFKDKLFNKICLLNFSGIVFFVYAAVHDFILFIKFEFILFILPFFGILFFVKERAKNAIVKLLSFLLLWATVLTFFCVFVTRMIYTAPSNVGVNDALIYHLFHFKKQVFENFWYNINQFCNKQNYQNKRNANIPIVLGSTCKKYAAMQEASHVINTYYKDTKGVMFLGLDGIEVLLAHHKYHAALINPGDELLVDVLQEKLLQNKVNELKYGEMVVVDKDVGIDVLQSDIARTLWNKFGFDKVDETPHLWVFKLVEKKDKGSPWFLSRGNFKLYIGVNGVVDKNKPIDDMNLSLGQYVGKVLTIEMDFDTPFMMTGLKFWHLHKNEMTKFRFFDNNAVKTFNVLVSMDGVRWDMVDSAVNYFMNDKKYYYKNIPPIQAKYVRLNAVVDESGMVLAPLEVFGHDEDRRTLPSL